MKLIPLIADNWRMDGGVAFGVVPKLLWQKVWTPDENNLIPIVSRCLLVDQGERKILIETGMGRKRDEKYYVYRGVDTSQSLQSQLLSHGYAPETVTDILFTHLHDDHVGGATYTDADGTIRLVFPNARYWVSETQWNWALNPNKREAASYFSDNLLPLKESGHLNLIAREGELFPGIEVRLYHGHTRGQLIPFIRLRGHTLVYMADFIPAHTHIPIPYIASVDIQPLTAMEEKSAFLSEAAEKGYILFFEHDDTVECCSVKTGPKGVILKECFSLNEIHEH